MTASDPSSLFSGTGEIREKHRFEVGRLEDFLSDRLPGFRRPLDVSQFKGGQSNPTYALSCPGGRYVMRRKPPGKLLPSAHAVDREYRVISALNRVGYAVPKAHVLCEDPDVIGTSFYVMERVEGRVLWDPLMPEQSPDERRAISDSFIETMTRLHAVDFEAIGLAEFGRPGNYYARQIGRWTKQYRASETEEIGAMERLMEWLPEHVPEDDSVGIVHGDFKLDNLVIHPTEPRIVAVLDWELSTLGHPLADLTYALSARQIPMSPFASLDDAELRSRGVLTVEETVDAYCRHTGRACVSDLDFYFAFHLFRSAAILQGIVGRVRDGTAANVNAIGKGGVAPIARSAMLFARKLGA
ncbi:MAG: phosphotransferase family protein [Myxococcales bacterium]|nr:phosphotransferase family protein [Myxococcales bacterium]